MGGMQPQPAVIVNESKLPEFVHKEIHARTGSPNDLRQSLLTYLWDYLLGFVSFTGRRPNTGICRH